MEFCPEIAVFHSSCNLANRLFPESLQNFERNGAEAAKVMQIVSQCVTEIADGLAVSNTNAEAKTWNMKLASLCTWNTISTLLPLETVLPVPPRVMRLIRPLPRWNAAFYCELIKQCSWIKYFVQIVDSMEKPGGIIFVNLIFCQFIQNGSEASDDLSIIGGLLEYFCLTDNSYLKNCHELMGSSKDGRETSGDDTSPSSTPQGDVKLEETDLNTLNSEVKTMNSDSDESEGNENKRGILPVLLDALQMAMQTEAVAVREQLRLLSVTTNLLNFLIHGKALVLKSDCFSGSNPYPSRNTVAFSENSSAACSGLSDLISDNLLASSLGDLPLTRSELPFQATPTPWLMSRLTEMLTAAKPFASNLPQLENYFDGIVESENFTGLLDLNALVYLNSYCEIFMEAYESLHSSIRLVADLSLRQSLAEFIAVLRSACEFVKRFVQTLELRKLDPKLVFERCLVVLARKLPGDKDSFDWLAETDCIDVITDKRWLKCLEENCEAYTVSNAESFLGLLASLKNMKQYFDTEQIDRLQRVLLKIFRKLPLDLENSVLEQLYVGLTASSSPFDVNVNDFRTNLRTTLNRFTSSTGHLEDDEMTRDVSCLALQRPLDTIRELISCSVQSKHHVAIISKVLLQLPVLARVTDETDDFVVLERLNHCLRSADISSKEQLNVLTLCQNLLKVRDGRSALCSTVAFLQTCVFSAGSDLESTLDTDLCLSSASLTLNLTLIACLSLEEQDSEEEAQDEAARYVVPLVAWLCQVIDNCRTLWPVSGYCRLDRSAVKEMAVRALRLLLQEISRRKHMVTECHLQWLRQQLASVHWTTFYHVRRLLGDESDHKSFPEFFQNLLSSSADGPNGLFVLLDLCRYGNEVFLLSALPEGGRFVFRNQPRLYAKIVFFLSQVIVNCLVGEWLRIASFLEDHLSAELFPAENPPPQEFLVCQVFTDIVLLVKETNREFSSEKALCIWQHLTNAFVSYFKTSFVCTKKAEAADRVDYIKAALGYILRFACIVPGSATEPLVILALDVLSGLPSLADKDATAAICNSMDDIKQAFTEVNKVVDLTAAIVKLNQLLV